jgi:hypothetical protein
VAYLESKDPPSLADSFLCSDSDGVVTPCSSWYGVKHRDYHNDKTPGLASRSTTTTARTDARFRCCFRKERRSLSWLVADRDRGEGQRREKWRRSGTDYRPIGEQDCLVGCIKAINPRRPRFSARREALLGPQVAKRSYQVTSGTPRSWIKCPRFFVEIRSLQTTVAFTDNEFELGFQTKKRLVHGKTLGSPDWRTNLGQQYNDLCGSRAGFLGPVAIKKPFRDLGESATTDCHITCCFTEEVMIQGCAPR